MELSRAQLEELKAVSRGMAGMPATINYRYPGSYYAHNALHLAGFAALTEPEDAKKIVVELIGACRASDANMQEVAKKLESVFSGLLGTKVTQQEDAA